MINKTKGLLTIIVPCYNGEKYIPRCISSLEDLQDDDISILFVNDGSTDSSEEMIRSWIKSHPNAYIVNKENGGYASAINFGLDHCGSEYVMFLGIDDEIIPSGIGKVCAHLRENFPDVLAFATIRIYDDEKQPLIKNKDPLTEYQEEGYFEMDAFSLCKAKKLDTRILFLRDTSRCFKMARVGDLRYFGEKGISADGCFSSLVVCQSNTFEFLNEDCYLWHLHRDSVSARPRSVEGLVDEANVWATFFSRIQSCFPNIDVPHPVIRYVWGYREVVLGLERVGADIISQKHKKNVRKIIKWILRSRHLSLKLRVALTFPKLCQFVVQIKQNVKK